MKQSQRSREKAPAIAVSHTHHEPRHSQMTSVTSTSTCSETPTSAHWLPRDQNIGEGSTSRRVQPASSELSSVSSSSMRQTPFDFGILRSWISNDSSATQSKLFLGPCASQPGLGLPSNDMSRVSPLDQASEVTDFRFYDPKLIPATNPPILVYPHSNGYITDPFHQRFREVVSMFRENTARHEDLGPFVQHIDYTLRMCGPSPDAALPSILVFCRKQEFRCLRALLTSRELGMQYLLRKPAKSPELFGWLRKTPALGSEYTSTPFFNLYFWRGIRPRTLLVGQDARVLVNSEIGVRSLSVAPFHYSLCGAVVQPLDSNLGSSTFGCAILVGEDLYGLTTRHNATRNDPDSTNRGTAVDPRPTKKAKQSHSSSEPPFPGSSADFAQFSDSCDFMIDDVGYESLSDCEGDDETQLSGEPLRVLPSSSDHEGSETPWGPTFVGGAIELPVRFLPHHDDLGPSSELDFDWAIFPMSGLERHARLGRGLINHTRVPGRGVMRHYATACPTRDRRVLLMTRDGTPELGTLRHGTSIIGGINGNRMSPVWTVGLDNNRGLKMGDSGSVVVDKSNDIIYGLVIGSNPIGEVYISPFAEIMKQVQHYFPHSVISLPEPESSLLDIHESYPFRRFSSRLFPPLPFTDQQLYLESAGTNPASQNASWSTSSYWSPPLSTWGSTRSYSPSFSCDSGNIKLEPDTRSPLSVMSSHSGRMTHLSAEERAQAHSRRGTVCVNCRVKHLSCDLGDGREACSHCAGGTRRALHSLVCVPFNLVGLVEEGSTIFSARSLVPHLAPAVENAPFLIPASHITRLNNDPDAGDVTLLHEGQDLYQLNMVAHEIVSHMHAFSTVESIERFIESRKRRTDWTAAIAAYKSDSAQQLMFELLPRFAAAAKEPAYTWVWYRDGREPWKFSIDKQMPDFVVLHLLSLVLGRQIEYAAWKELQRRAEGLCRKRDNNDLDKLTQPLHVVRKVVTNSRSGRLGGEASEEEVGQMRVDVDRDTELCRRLYFIVCALAQQKGPWRIQPSTSKDVVQTATKEDETMVEEWEATLEGFEQWMRKG